MGLIGKFWLGKFGHVWVGLKIWIRFGEAEYCSEWFGQLRSFSILLIWERLDGFG